MTSSLVGSEMCIRDSRGDSSEQRHGRAARQSRRPRCTQQKPPVQAGQEVDGLYGKRVFCKRLLCALVLMLAVLLGLPAWWCPGMA
eukprot:3009049-Prorocentrum_lima.AAC.1